MWNVNSVYMLLISFTIALSSIIDYLTTEQFQWNNDDLTGLAFHKDKAARTGKFLNDHSRVALAKQEGFEERLAVEELGP